MQKRKNNVLSARDKRNIAVSLLVAYLERGVQYHLLARQAIFCAYMSVAGVLAHHSIEMLLLAGLARQYTAEELKKRYKNHSLPTMWEDFKKGIVRSSRLAKFDSTIQDYHKWERIRFPGMLSGAHVMTTGIKRIDRTDRDATKPRIPNENYFDISLEEIDELFREIIVAMGITHGWVMHIIALKKEAKELYERDNKFPLPEKEE